MLATVSAGVFYPVYQQRQQNAPQRLLSEAIELDSRGQVAAAERNYSVLHNKFPASEEAAEALFRLAQIQQFARRDVRKALRYYLQLEKDYPESRQLLAAREESARIVKFSLRDYSRAISYYQRLLDGESGTPDRYLYEIADCYFRLENYPQAGIELETLIEEHPDSPLMADALYRRGGFLVLEHNSEQARQSWQTLIERFPHSSYRPQAEFNLARLLEEDERLAEALEKYRQLEDFPRPAMLREKIEHLEKRIAEKKKAI